MVEALATIFKSPGTSITILPMPTKSTSGASLYGCIFNPEHLPLPGARVYISKKPAPGRNHYYEYTDEAGRYEIAGITPGDYKVWVTHRLFRMKFSKLSFGAASEQVEWNAQLEKGTSISGRVIDSAGGPVGHTSIMAGDTEVHSYTQTEADGTFTLHGLGEKRVTISVVSPDIVGTRAEAEPGTSDLTIQLGYGTLEIAIEGEPAPSGYSFDLRTVGAEDKWGLDTDYGRPTTNIHLRGFKAGTYELNLSAIGYETADRPVFTVTPDSAHHRVRLYFRRKE